MEQLQEWLERAPHHFDIFMLFCQLLFNQEFQADGVDRPTFTLNWGREVSLEPTANSTALKTDFLTL